MARPTQFERVASTFGGQRSIYAARRGMAPSTKRKNRVLHALVTTLQPAEQRQPPIYLPS